VSIHGAHVHERRGSTTVAEEHAHVEAFFVARRDRVHATNDFAGKSLALLPWLIRVLCAPREVLSVSMVYRARS
jgi:hypothetical protein